MTQFRATFGGVSIQTALLRGWRALIAAPTIISTFSILLCAGVPAHAMAIEKIVSPGGIEAWLVRDTTVPLIAMDFAFRGGANGDPDSKPGVASLVSSLLDEGAGELDAKAFQERLQEWAVQISFRAGRDYFYGSLRTLTENRDRGFDLLRMALTAPRFDADAVERVRGQTLSVLRRETTSPSDIARKNWWSAAFKGHPYAQPVGGTLDSVPQIDTADLRDYARRIFARDTLKVAVVGDIDAQTAGTWIDAVFGALPAKADLRVVPQMAPRHLGERIVSDLDVPQTVITFGGQGLDRKDPDFFAGYIVNHILGGGSFSSRLYSEVREKRGLAYSVHTALHWLKHAALFVGGTATRADRAGEALDVMQREITRIAETGPTSEELDKAKSYLKGSYALGFDTSGKIASQLLSMQLDELGIDYVDKRGHMIDAVTLADVRRAAKRVFGGGLLVSVVGRAQSLVPKGG